MDNEALALWKEWFDDSDPVEAPLAYYKGNPYCFFCGRDNPLENGHEENCIYIRAKEFVRGPQFQGLNQRVGNDR